MLDNENFEVVLDENNLEYIKDVAKLYEKLHCSTSTLFQLKSGNASTLVLVDCYDKNQEAYPLDVLLPMLRYKVDKLPQTQDGFYGGDGDNYTAIKIYMDGHGLKFKRVYIYAGK